MNRVFINAILILFIVFFYLKNRHGLHILQLENYYNDRYIVWMKKNLSKIFNIKMIGLFLISSIVAYININIGLILSCLTYILLIFNHKRNKEKKPFVVTIRIKRMYITYLILIILLAISVNVIDYKISLSIINIVAIFSYVWVYIVNLLNRPLEKYIRRGFCKKANSKLKDINGLEVIGITGSYGKTSTKYVVNTILSQKYNTVMTPESYNTTMGVVRTVNEKVSSTHKFFVCEMGAKYIGDIKEICDIVEPKYAIITAIGPQHLDTFKNIENISKTKLELIDAIPEDDGIAFVNWEDENIRKAKINKKIIKYGLTSASDYYADNIVITEKGSSFDVVMPKKRKINIKTKLLGELNILNIVCAISVADTLGLSEDEIKIGVKYIKPVKHRLELKQNPNGSIIIDDAYNSNVKGAKMALEVLKTFENKKRILITPGIVELGEKSNEINKELGILATKSSDFIILVGANQAVPIYEGIKETNYSLENVFIAENLQEALLKMNEIIDNNSVVLLENDLPDNYL